LWHKLIGTKGLLSKPDGNAARALREINGLSAYFLDPFWTMNLNLDGAETFDAKLQGKA
jgi:hypothetical protein